MKIAIIENPVKNLPKIQTDGLTKVTCINALNEARLAKAENVLICPTLLISFGQ
tara:strand:- start:592 stop:753 length:162 start_codon:yes stop_codon:yes gene_type:complete